MYCPNHHPKAHKFKDLPAILSIVKTLSNTSTKHSLTMIIQPFIQMLAILTLVMELIVFLYF